MTSILWRLVPGAVAIVAIGAFTWLSDRMTEPAKHQERLPPVVAALPPPPAPELPPPEPASPPVFKQIAENDVTGKWTEPPTPDDEPDLGERHTLPDVPGVSTEPMPGATSEPQQAGRQLIFVPKIEGAQPPPQAAAPPIRKAAVSPPRKSVPDPPPAVAEPPPPPPAVEHRWQTVLARMRADTDWRHAVRGGP